MSNPVSAGSGPARTPDPPKTMGTPGTRQWIAGHATEPPGTRLATSAFCVAAMTSGERPSRNPETINARKPGGSGQNGTRTDARALSVQLSPAQSTRRTTAGGTHQRESNEQDGEQSRHARAHRACYRSCRPLATLDEVACGERMATR